MSYINERTRHASHRSLREGRQRYTDSCMIIVHPRTVAGATTVTFSAVLLASCAYFLYKVTLYAVAVI